MKLLTMSLSSFFINSAGIYANLRKTKAIAGAMAIYLTATGLAGKQALN
jgi:hypothetical protein